MNRRSFITKSATAAAFAGAYNLLPAQSLGANGRVNVAVIGLGGMGSVHVKKLKELSGVKIMALCDADTDRIDKNAQVVPDALKVQDYRKILDMKEIDAVFIATPNHWHAPLAIAACQAGKHVYVQKPVSHCLWESRQMLKARKKYNRVIQAGTQQLSCPSVIECGEDIRSGVYGKVLWAHSFKINSRGPVGKRSEPLQIAKSIDYNLWAGPAPMDPLYRNQLHYDWHWDLRWGDGEMGNWAVHYTSDLTDMLGWSQMPDSVMSAGGRFLWDDAADAPNMLFSAMEHQGIPLTVEIRNLKRAKGSKAMPAHMGMRGGNVIMCEKALLKMSRGGGRAFTPDGKETIKAYKGNAGAGHEKNFIDAVRANDQSMLTAPIEGGHLGTGCCHLANLSYKLGVQSSPEEVRERMSDYEDIRATTDAHLEQLKANEVDWDHLMLGPKLSFDPVTETFTGAHANEANRLQRYDMRKEFAVPEQV